MTVTIKETQIVVVGEGLIDVVTVGIQGPAGAGGGVTDGDKGDITVSGSGTTWTIDNGVVDIANLSATGTPSASTYLRGDNTWATVSGSGTVTSVSVTTANGVSGTVANPTTTPAISLTLGAITPTTIVASGAVSGSNLSGTNTGDQNLFSTIAVSGQSNVVADTNTDTLTLVAGSNITITTNATTDEITISSTGGGGGAPTGAEYVVLATNGSLTNERVLTAGTGISITDAGAGSTVTVASTITQYTDELAQDAVGNILTDSSTVDFTYNDAGNTITAAVIPNTSTQRIEVTRNSGSVVGTRKQLNFIEGSNISLTIADDGGNDQVDITIAAAGGGGTPGGSSGQLQFNNASVFAGAAFSTVATSGTHLRLTAQSATDIPLVTRAATSQTANVQEWQNNAGTVGVYVDPAATSIFASTNVAAGNSFFFYLRNLLMSWRAATLGDSGNAYTFADSGGTALKQIKASTLMLTTNNTDTLATATRFAAVCGSPTQMGGIFRADAAQSVPIVEFQNSSGTPLSSISSTGVYTGSGAGLTGTAASLTSGLVTSVAGNVSAGSNISFTGAGTIASPYVISASGSLGSSFDTISGGTNTTAAMVVGTGASIAATGSGTIVATSTTGNAATATALQTARTINGTSFDGSANITVTAAAGTLTGATLAAGVTASSLTSVGTLANLTVTNPITGSINGNAATVTTNANLTGDVTSTGNATAIASNVIVDADINASAGILLSKTNMSLTTTGTSGAATLNTTTGVLNIPQYTGGAGGGLSIGLSYAIAANLTTYGY